MPGCPVMDCDKIVALLAPALALAACGEPATQPVAPATSDTAVAPAPAPTPSAPAIASPSPALLTPEAEQGETGARDVLLSFARAIEQRHLDQAWEMLSPADRRKWSRSAFRDLFADLVRPTVAVPGGRMEGAAGSTYYTAPVTITGHDADGRPVRMEGKAVLRRVNVDGAPAARRRWHFETLELNWTH